MTPTSTASPSPTVTVTASPSVTPTLTPLACSIVFDFATDEQGWTYLNQRPPYHEVIGTRNSAGTGSLDMTTTTNKTCFAYWESPLLDKTTIAPCPQTGEPITAATLFRVTWKMFSNQVDPTLMPVIRLRTSSEDFQRTDAIAMTAINGAALSLTQTPRTYVQYFMQPASQNMIRLDYDLLSFSPEAGYHVTAAMDEVTLEAINEPDPLTANVVRNYDFVADAPAEWVETLPSIDRDIPVPGEFDNTNGLLIRGVPTIVSETEVGIRDTILFGYWGAETNVPIQGGLLYRLRWSVTSDATESNHAALPIFRMRMNDSTLKFTSIVNIDSVNADARVPFDGAVENYDMWFVAPAEIDGSTMILSFDYLYVDKSSTASLDVDDPTLGITLNALEITNFGAATK